MDHNLELALLVVGIIVVLFLAHKAMTAATEGIALRKKRTEGFPAAVTSLADHLLQVGRPQHVLGSVGGVHPRTLLSGHYSAKYTPTMVGSLPVYKI